MEFDHDVFQLDFVGKDADFVKAYYTLRALGDVHRLHFHKVVESGRPDSMAQIHDRYHPTLPGPLVRKSFTKSRKRTERKDVGRGTLPQAPTTTDVALLFGLESVEKLNAAGDAHIKSIQMVYFNRSETSPSSSYSTSGREESDDTHYFRGSFASRGPSGSSSLNHSSPPGEMAFVKVVPNERKDEVILECEVLRRVACALGILPSDSSSRAHVPLPAAPTATVPRVISVAPLGTSFHALATSYHQHDGCFPRDFDSLGDAIMPIARLLAQMHALNLLQGDIKPEHIRVPPHAPPCLVDMGRACGLTDHDNSSTPSNNASTSPTQHDDSSMLFPAHHDDNPSTSPEDSESFRSSIPLEPSSSFSPPASPIKAAGHRGTAGYEAPEVGRTDGYYTAKSEVRT